MDGPRRRVSQGWLTEPSSKPWTGRCDFRSLKPVCFYGRTSKGLKAVSLIAARHTTAARVNIAALGKFPT